MSHFYGTVKGARSEASRQGSKTSGIEGHIRGWNIGAKVVCFVDNKGQDKVAIYLTSGSNGSKLSKTIGVYTEGDLK